jgi:hypothetical protein
MKHRNWQDGMSHDAIFALQDLCLIFQQATFTALNVEPDDNFDDDVDNTREIQVWDAVFIVCI